MKQLCLWAALVGIVSVAGTAWAAEIRVEDMAGRSVSVPAGPDRICCIGPGALRLVVYLQAQDNVVAVEEMEKTNPGGRPYWLAHPELHDLPRCGPGGPAAINKKPDLETLLAVDPQVIFVTYMDGPLADEIQKTLGIPVVVLSYGAFANFDEAVYEAIGIVGRILGRQKRASAVVDYIESLRKDLQERTADIPPEKRPRAYVGGIGYRGAYGLESTEQAYAPLDWVNAVNLAAQIESGPGGHVFVGKETLLGLNPEVIFIDGGGLALVKADYRKKPRFYNALQAFSKGRVYVLLPFNWYTTNIGTALADACTIGKILYPDRFSDVDPKKKADEIYAFLVGKPVYADMEADYGPIGRLPGFLEK